MVIDVGDRAQKSTPRKFRGEGILGGYPYLLQVRRIWKSGVNIFHTALLHALLLYLCKDRLYLALTFRNLQL